MIDTATEQIYTYIEENDDMQELRNAITTEDEKIIRKRLIDRYHDNIVISCKFGSNNAFVLHTKRQHCTKLQLLLSSATSPEIKPGSFAQFVHDNADLNINTIDGKAPSDYNTIYTAMKTSVENAKQLNMRTCILTFDQPLYMKAWDIASAVCLSDEALVAVRLGSFHTVMSYMGSIG
ncbi:uncharacterized protein TNCV_3912671 [Trichonephila clavipes]|nr:uncharacterized protein TNCV_3912671 [Trichonephila clavipes]